LIRINERRKNRRDHHDLERPSNARPWIVPAPRRPKMSTPHDPPQPIPCANAGPRGAANYPATPPVYPRSGYARKHPRLPDPPLRRGAPDNTDPPDFGNAV
jgi:hypothetical protein